MHGRDNRGISAGSNPGIPYGRFGKMFNCPPNTKLPDEALKLIASAMIKKDLGKPITEAETADENPTIPAGYTYFGQFVDHDITFDPTPLSAERSDPAALIDFRTPALDLDSVYGRGPDDQPYLYDGVRLRTGEPRGNANAVVGTQHDLFRILDGVPLLGDKRNDENKIVSQLHGAIIAFHNKVVADDALMQWAGANLTEPRERFDAAVSIVRWHYQWVVLFDYLDRICEPGMVTEILNDGGVPRLNNYLKTDAQYPYMPVEFAGAAFRFGHSMVRPSYALNRFVGTQPGPDDPNDETTKRRIPTFSTVVDPDHPTPAEQLMNMNGFPGTLPKDWGVDWGYFLDGISANINLPDQHPPESKAQVPQPSYRIDAILVQPLTILPEFQKQAIKKNDQFLMHLAFRNLRRGQLLDLPSGEAVARQLGITPLPADILWSAGSRHYNDPSDLPEESKADFEAIISERKRVFFEIISKNYQLEGNTPLWYYVLREAEYYGTNRSSADPGVVFGGQHLGPVGSRIVAETLIGLLYLDKNSFLHCLPKFKPHPQITGGASEFTLDRLIAYALT